MRLWKGAKFLSHNNREEWLAIRKTLGIGGSESAAILGLSPYSCAAQVFYDKLGFNKPRPSSLPMIIGIEDEDKIAKLWSHYEPQIGFESIARNYDAKRVIRKPMKFNKIVVNEKYPFLFGNVDRLFMNGKDRSILEMKTINHWEANKWESGVPIHYVIQIQHYMLVFEAKYAELAILEANSQFTVVPFEPSPAIHERIIAKCHDFWELIKEAQAILDKGGSELDIQHLVPGPDGSDAYTEFLKDKYGDSVKEPDAIVTATTEDLVNLKAMLETQKQIEEMQHKMNLYEQQLRARITETPILDFGDQYGRVTWRPDKNGRRIFRTNSVKKDAVLSL